MLKLYFLSLTALLISISSLALPPDSVIVSASTKYSKPGISKRIFIGSNYRKDWGMPVKMKVFDISKEKGGFIIKKLGGGMQTKSLKLLDKDGIEWTLRTVDKDVTKAVASKGQESKFVKKVVQDMISGGYPYGALTIPVFSRALGVVAAEPELFFVPDDTAFGKYREFFANTVCMLEREEPTIDNSEALKTAEMDSLLKLTGGNIDQHNLLQARLIDMLIADWDRHGEQWQWGVKQVDGKAVYYAIPKDRDQAYFNYNGVLIRLVRPLTLKHLIGFKKKSKRLRTLNTKEWDFDRLYMNELTEEDWRNGIRSFRGHLTDSILEAAVRQMPVEIYERSGKMILRRLKSRMRGMERNGMKYYKFVAESIVVRGTDKAEIFRISKDGKGLIITIVDAESQKVMFTRKLNKSEAKEICLEGLGGNDVFQLDEDVKLKRVQLKVMSGEGQDTYLIKGQMKMMHDEETKKELEAAVSK